MSEDRGCGQTKKLRPGFARIEFIAIAKRADELMEMGHTIQSAYEELRKEKKVTMTYDSFRRHLNQRRKSCALKGKEEALLKSGSNQKVTQTITTSKNAAFNPQVPLDESSLV